MRSVADALRDETRAAALRLTPGERIELALALGDTDVGTLAAARRIAPSEAKKQLARQRQQGRCPSACHSNLLA